MTVQIVSTVLAPAATYAMVDLAIVKDELSLGTVNTGNDAWLTRVIAQVSKAIMNDTNRVFAPEYVEDVIDVRRVRSQVPSGVAELQLSRWPVIAIGSVVQQSSALDTSVPLTEGVDYRVDPDNGRLLRLDGTLGRVSAWEPLTVTVAYSAGYGDSRRESHSVPGSAPYTVQVNSGAGFSCDQFVTGADGTRLDRVAGAPAQGEYAVDAASATYTFAAADAGADLSFAFCTASVPEDVEEACLRMVCGRYRAKGRDPALVQRDTDGVGSERFWFGGAPGQQGPFPPDIEALLDNYHVPVIA